MESKAAYVKQEDLDKIWKAIKIQKETVDNLMLALELVIKKLEQTIPPTTPYPMPAPVATNDRCPTCFMAYKDMTHYVCMNMNCPNGRVVWST